MAREVYRYRKCPRCKRTFPAGKFKILNYHGTHYHQRGGSMRKCPGCGLVSFTQTFKVVTV